MQANSDQRRDFLRHTVATLAYRGRKALIGVQGPVADALTHVGQIAMCRRLAGAAPVRGENYFLAGITLSHAGLEQAPAVREFD